MKAKSVLKRWLFLALLLLTCCIYGCAERSNLSAGIYPQGPPSEMPKLPESSVFSLDLGSLSATQKNNLKTELLISEMSLEQKIGQLFFARVPAKNKLEDLRTFHLGGYILFGRDTAGKTVATLSEEISAFQQASDFPLVIGVDEEGGSVVRLSSNKNLRHSRFKSPQALFAEGGMEKIVSDTAEKDALLELVGINVNLAPVADVSVSPDDFIYERSFGKGAKETAEYVERVVAQMSSDGIGSVLKHFPGYGSNADTHTGSSVDTRSLESFRQSDFLPFKAGFSAGGKAVAVMVSHNVMTCVDSKNPASLSPAVHNILRNELGFDGVIMTDDLAMDAVKGYDCPALAAIKAGNDMVICTDYKTQIPAVLQAVKKGIVSEDIINDAVRRVLGWKISLGLI